MAFQLNSVVPWGRTFAEYQRMFLLNDTDLTGKIAGFGDGPASFNFEATQKGCSVTSFDPVYQFSLQQLRDRIASARVEVMTQMARNQEHYVWKEIPSLQELEQRRMSAMELFLADYPTGIAERRYIPHTLPEPLPYSENFFDLGLSSHFLLMYTQLGYEFHIRSITEMLRVCREVRIFPLLNLDSQRSRMIAQVIQYFHERYTVIIQTTPYEFQKGGNRLLTIRK